MTNLPVLDHAVVDSLVERAGRRHVTNLIALFSGETDDALPGLSDGAASGDYRLVGNIAHALRGTAEALGAAALAANARELEDACANKDHERMRVLAGRVEADARAAVKALYAWRSRSIR